MISQALFCSDMFQMATLTRAVAYRSVLPRRDVKARPGKRDRTETQLAENKVCWRGGAGSKPPNKGLAPLYGVEGQGWLHTSTEAGGFF
jgi:hypothetical protein